MSHLPYVWNIHDIVHDNKSFRKVLYTGDQLQIVAMCLQPWDDTGQDMYEKQDVIIRVEKWEATIDVDGFEYKLDHNMAIVVPVWSKHITRNTDKEHRLYIHLIYALPLHIDHKIHNTKEDSEKEKPKPALKPWTKLVVRKVVKKVIAQKSMPPKT